uniref:Uncharacterized protein n=1 Tax=Anopheles maculatus TaxID=74869 RepID=A0A182SKY3_9DIPT
MNNEFGKGPVEQPNQRRCVFWRVSKVTGWLGNASIPSMPAIPTVSMPAMPAMPSMPSIPGLRKANQTDENGGITNEGLVTSPEKASQGIAGSTDAADEEDR